MKKKDAIIISVLAVLFVAMILLWAIPITFTGDELTDTLILDCAERAIGAALVITAIYFYVDKKMLYPRLKGGKSALLWCLPCLAVALANFPYSALILNSAKVDYPALIPLFLVSCVLTGVFEELLFRGIFQDVIADLVKKKKYADILTVLFTSLLFGVWHLLNLLAGAGIGATLLQAGYSFLIGAMLSCTLMRTGNIWICAALHALFNVGGLLVPTLGSGAFQDTCFWCLTAICGIICAAHVIYYLINRTKNSQTVEEKQSRTTDEI